MKRTLTLWVVTGILGFCIFPWYMTDSGFWSSQTLRDPLVMDSASGLVSIFYHDRWWLFLPLLSLIGVLLVQCLPLRPVLEARLIAGLAIFALSFCALQGLVISRSGPSVFPWLWGEAASSGQPGMGIGAGLFALSALFVLTSSVSHMGRGRGDAFVTGMIGLIVSLVVVFVFYPVLHILVQALQLPGGGYAFSVFASGFFASDIWDLSCLFGGNACGVAINSIFLAVSTGLGTTVLGLAFALFFTRTAFPAKKLLRVLTVIPIITPPFVIGLALILLFGRTGTITEFAADLFGVEKSRWLYGFWGIYFAQMLSFTPIAFLVLIGVVEGVSPSMEEASQTLDANRWQTFRFVSLPLMRPGLANAFLLGFIESLADFGNPLVLGGNYDVLSTEIYYAIVGSVADPARAAILAFTLLLLTLTAFIAQRTWLGKKSYATVTGKADSGQHAALSPMVKRFCYGITLPWAALTAIVYSMIVFGSFVKLWGYNHSFTTEHYVRAFGIDFSDGIRFVGAAWDSYFTTLTISTAAAPLTALIGLATAYLLVRQKFIGKSAFEFGTMLSFAIPGTVIGVSYIMAFNFPPIELTGTSVILIVVFVFRNMPVGVRGGVAAMSQLDKSLDEASLTLGANSFTTVRRVIAPLMGPAMLAALTYSFVRAITSVSAVIFLVSAKHNMATSFIVGRVENGEFGFAIAYSAVLIVTMLAAILGLQFLIGQRRLRRTNRVEGAVAA
ncbi:MAG: iron ABC transporter permease [Roseibium sp.]|uniref:ABC transporter permease n=1 Tax=Roseibium sp. TaxID=1936156 RepID=UPI001B1083E8|nr:iron ABC transporter permease [Roseibium sp.]MBO6890300.1 iron ABC transporter permease [Roseibium sp.]MBO6932584.1 iron ABC transporter permease [Roseibium sp.]